MKIHRKVAWLTCALAASALLAGCATRPVTYNGEQYSSPEGGLNAARNLCQEGLSGITPREDPVASDLDIRLLSSSAIRQNHEEFNKFNKPAEWVLHYLTQVTEIELDCMRRALKRSKIVKNVNATYSSGKSHAMGEEAPVVYIYQPSPSRSQWYFKSPTIEERVTVNFDRGIPVDKRYAKFIERVADMLRAS